MISVCAAVSRRSIGVDIEKIRPLSAETIRDIGAATVTYATVPEVEHAEQSDNSIVSKPNGVSTADSLPVVLFTQKEAILKANGIGLARGLSDVQLAQPTLNTRTTATHCETEYDVFSTLHAGHAFSVAWVKDDSAPSTAVRSSLLWSGRNLVP